MSNALADIVHHHCLASRRRAAAVAALRFAPFGAAVGGVAGICVVLSRGEAVLIVLLGLACTAIAASAGFALVWRRQSTDIARGAALVRLDAACGAKDAVLTALDGQGGPFAALVEQRALAAVSDADARLRALPRVSYALIARSLAALAIVLAVGGTWDRFVDTGHGSDAVVLAHGADDEKALGGEESAAGAEPSIRSGDDTSVHDAQKKDAASSDGASAESDMNSGKKGDAASGEPDTGDESSGEGVEKSAVNKDGDQPGEGTTQAGDAKEQPVRGIPTPRAWQEQARKPEPRDPMLPPADAQSTFSHGAGIPRRTETERLPPPKASRDYQSQRVDIHPHASDEGETNTIDVLKKVYSPRARQVTDEAPRAIGVPKVVSMMPAGIASLGAFSGSEREWAMRYRGAVR